MLNYARQRALEVLKHPRTAILASSGPAGIQAGEFPCEALGIDLYMLLPKSSEHIFNLEHEHSVTILTPKWEVRGEAELIDLESFTLKLGLSSVPGVEWCWLVRIRPRKINIRREKGWGYCESIEI
jgi:hypothetical protein